jgi:radical SAM protein with 4Fe4S-binding SPASM domain
MPAPQGVFSKFMLVRDKWNILRKLSLRKAGNALLLYSGYYFSKLVRRPFHLGMPLSLAIEPTTSCNLRCPECPSGKRAFSRPTGMLDEQHFRRIIDQVSANLVYLTFYFQGEPYLHPGFTDMVRYASGKRIYTATSTNAHYLDDANAERTVRSGLDRLIISMDGTTQETYASYRAGGSLEKVIAGTRNILKWKKALGSRTPHVIFQFLVVKPNEHQVEEVKALAADLGVEEVRLKTAQVYEYKQGNALIPENERYSRYKKNGDGTWSLKHEPEDHCWKMWQSCVITWDGKVVPCCFDKDAHHQMGEVGKVPFRTIWKSEDYTRFRAAILRSRKEIDICANCSEGAVVFAE